MEENMENEITHIQISKNTAKMLKNIKIAKAETYDEIINRLFVMAVNNK